jgi:hypothetical protein
MAQRLIDSQDNQDGRLGKAKIVIVSGIFFMLGNVAIRR